ncbi:hypothetical protein FZEAL_9824 [Fusarium zealandicum]|uniref:Dynamin family protein n=1 Tax=Fusarium zealandicum TaxID=1053134 RepID=A0A8H4XEL3_9HYPO|nr:hypothetical protein FZEAL_9824 [Fusarium zealandicum]
MDVSLSSDVLNQLNTAEAKALHDIGDSLSACGVGKIVNLPQIIVVGEQSSGKSSVLEAISHVRFPVEGGLCTRFATELVLRQAQESRVDVSVRFADKSKATQTFHRTGFRDDDLPDIIKEAKECMGFTRAGKDFSKDVLRLDIQGPNMYPLSLVDLPGLFHTESESQSLGGKETVNELVESYMRQKNSIILVVVTANNQLESHVALSRVREIDPLKQRTLGVITKPDLTLPGYANEKTYVRVAKNQEGANKLQLGWHVLRNRAEDEASLDARDKVEEDFFKTGAWSSIPQEDRGIASLRKKLSRVLYNHIRNSLPGVVDDIETKLRERQEELDRLGKARSSQEDMRSFLLTIAGDFQRLARDGIHGRYNDAFFGGLEDEDRKLRALLRNFNRAFDHVLKTKGSTQEILPEHDGSEVNELPEYLEEFLERYPYEFADPEIITTEELNAQLQKQAAANQGCEFPGSPNKDLAIQLFKKQATPWKKIAEFHVSRVTVVAKSFVDELFNHVVGPVHANETTEAILSTCVDPFFNEKEKLLQVKLEELLRPYEQGYAVPLDVEFFSHMSQKATDRLASRFCDIMQRTYPEMFDEESTKRLNPRMLAQAISLDEGMKDGEFGTDKVIDMMLAYYEMSRRTFTDNVINLAIESCLVCEIPDILTPTQVDRMSKERLQELAAESDDTSSRRENLQEEVDVLRQGLAQCRRYRPRTVTALPSRQGASPAAKKATATPPTVTNTPPPPQVQPPQQATPKAKTAATPANATATPTANHGPKAANPVHDASKPPASTFSLPSGSFAGPFGPSDAKPTSPAPKTSGLFGSGSASSTASTFGTKPAAPAGGLFSGTKTDSPASGSSGLFASSTSTSSGAFGSSGSKPTAHIPSLFNTPATTPASTPSTTKPANNGGFTFGPSSNRGA